MNKEYYSNFKQFLTDLTTKENNIRKDLEAFKTAIGNNENTIEIENRINKELKSLKDLIEQLTEAYSSKNAPPNMPEDTLDARQKDIKKFSNSYDELIKDLQKLRDDKYTFNPNIYALVGAHSKKKYALGDKIDVEVRGIDRTEGNIAFAVSKEREKVKKYS